MKIADLQPIQPKSFVPRTTDSTHGKGYWPNLLLDKPVPTAPNLVWVSDITYLPLINGEWAYLGGWLDLFSRRIVGWRVNDNMEDALVISPLRMALQSRQPAHGLITHSDRGGQYVSNDLQELVSLWRIRPSMSRAAPRWPTTLTTMHLQNRSGSDRRSGRLKVELLEGGCFLSVDDARTEIFEYIESYYNRVRKHSSLGYKSPEQVENEYYKNLQV
jgi:transposase InsO family protein